MARLVREPFCYKPWEIGKLTFRQIALIFARKPEEIHDPAPDGSASSPVASYKDVFFNVWRKRGMTDEWIQARYVAKMQELQNKKSSHGRRNKAPSQSSGVINGQRHLKRHRDSTHPGARQPGKLARQPGQSDQ